MLVEHVCQGIGEELREGAVGISHGHCSQKKAQGWGAPSEIKQTHTALENNVNLHMQNKCGMCHLSFPCCVYNNHAVTGSMKV